MAALAVVSLAAGVVSVGGSMYLVTSYSETTQSLEAEATLLAGLRADLVAETIAMSSAAGDPRRLRAATSLGPEIDARFVTGTGGDTPPAVQRPLREASATWRGTVASILALDPKLPAAQRVVVAGKALSDQAPKVLALLDDAGAASRAAARSELAAHRRVDSRIVGSLILLMLLVLAMVARLGRRLSHQVLAPVDRLRASANTLASGDLAHRVEVHSDDELGALAASFNAMADAIAGSQQVLSTQANQDSLTGLANRGAFHARVAEALARQDRRLDGTQAVLFVDLDDFKDVNDLLGHAAGDTLLQIVAARLNSVVRPGDLVARLGGDEFALFLDSIPDASAAHLLAERAVHILAEPVDIDGERVQVGASVGLAMRQLESDIDTLMREADMAMYSAKGHGKNRVECYDASLHHAVVEHHALKTDIDSAAGRDELVLHYQPVVELRTGALVGVEALVRWQHPTRGLLPPSAFIELAEQTGAIEGIGRWVLRCAADQMHSWQRRYARPDLALAVNVSVCQLREPGFAATVREIVGASGLQPGSLVLEVTESVLIDDTTAAAATLAELRNFGVRVAIDDFGTGFASIGYLRTLPVDILKIDRTFVSGPQVQGPGETLLEAVVALGRHLGLEVIPEGIENEADLTRLRALGCDVGQGFLLSRPVPPGDVDTWLAGADQLLPIEFYPAAPPARPVIPGPRAGDWSDDVQAVLDAMPDATAILDGDGRILGVNAAWNMFAADNRGLASATGIGVNYLEVCDRASARGCADSALAATAIRAVLAGETVEREFEYACPSPSIGRWFVLKATPLVGRRPGVLVSHVNITRRKAAKEVLRRRASEDPLTGLANRSLLKERLADALEPRAGRHHAPDVGVLVLDLDGFKPVNDTFGHAAGDEILLEVAARLRRAVRPQDTVARPGGDEFAIVAPRITAEALATLHQRVVREVGRPHLVHGQLVIVGVSGGRHLAGAGEDPTAALATADADMYATKHGTAPEGVR
ncbi:MAG: diguanylate cyclase [Actinomycetota bacterium]|nr:diguanylate cyclase [Actinomycetota bacterium]